jgi:hypothetical protein
MGSLQDELKTKLANPEFVTGKREEGRGPQAPNPSPSVGVVEHCKLAGTTPNPVPQFGSLADYAAAVTKLCEKVEVEAVQALATGLDRYSPSEAEQQYRALKTEVKQLHTRLVQARRLAAAISK